MIHAIGVTHRKKIAIMTSGLITRCIKRPRASHARFNGRKMLGRITAASAKAKATPKAHHRGSDLAMSGQPPTTTNTPGKRATKLRSELAEGGTGVRLGSRTTAMPHLRCCGALLLVAKRNRRTQLPARVVPMRPGLDALCKTKVVRGRRRMGARRQLRLLAERGG